MINIEFLIITYLVGMFIDWVLQWDWQAINKSKWSKKDNKIKSTIALITHSLIYAIFTTVIVSLFIELNNYYFIILITLFITHAIIDSRIPVKWIMKFKGMTNNQINDYNNYGYMHIGIDHRLHELVIFILAILLK